MCADYTQVIKNFPLIETLKRGCELYVGDYGICTSFLLTDTKFKKSVFLIMIYGLLYRQRSLAANL